MSNSLKLFLEIGADAAKLRDALRKSGNDVNTWGRKCREEAQHIRSVYDSIAGRVATLGLSVGMGASLWQSGKLDKSLTQIGQTAGATAQDLARLRQDLFTLGKESGQDIENLKDGFNILVQSGLNMKEAGETIKGVNTAMAVSGAEARTLANGLTVAATAFQFDLAKPGQALEILDRMTVAGRLGNAELQNLSDIFARVGVNAKSAGMSIEKTLGFIEALSMVERSPERLATLADSTLRAFTNMRYMAAAQRGTGIQFYDKEGTRRDPLAVLKDIQAKYKTLKTDKQKDLFVEKAFGKSDYDTIKGIKTLLQGRAIDNVEEFSRKIAEAGGTLKRDLNEATANLPDQAGKLKASMREAADNFARPVNQVLADLIKWGLDSKKNGGLELSGKQIIGGGVAAMTGTILAARYGSKMIEWLQQKSGIPGGVLNRAATAGRIGEFLGVQAGAKAIGVNLMPVFVTNWPDGIKGGSGSKGGSGAADTAKDILTGAGAGAVATRAKLILEFLKTVALRSKDFLALRGLPFLPRQYLVPAILGYGTGWLANKGAGAIAGMASGGKYSGSGWLGQMVYDMRHREEALAAAVASIKPSEVKNQIQMSVRIDADRRVTTTVNGLNTDVDISLERGTFDFGA